MNQFFLNSKHFIFERTESFLSCVATKKRYYWCAKFVDDIFQIHPFPSTKSMKIDDRQTLFLSYLCHFFNAPQERASCGKVCTGHPILKPHQQTTQPVNRLTHIDHTTCPTLTSLLPQTFNPLTKPSVPLIKCDRFTFPLVTCLWQKCDHLLLCGEEVFQTGSRE